MVNDDFSRTTQIQRVFQQTFLPTKKIISNAMQPEMSMKIEPG